MSEYSVTLVDSDTISDNPELFDRPSNLLFQQDIPARQFVYGHCVVKCSRFFHRVKSPNFYSGLLISDGFIEKITSLFIGEKEYQLPTARGALIENGVYNAGLFEVDPQLGNGSPSLLNSVFNDVDNSAALAAVAHLSMRCHFGNHSEQHSDLWGSALPDTVRVKGLKVLDVRDNVVKFSNNAALVIYHFLINVWKKQIDSGYINMQSFKDAANVCDQLVDGNPRYTIDGIVRADRSVVNTLQGLLSSCGGALTYSAGLYHLHVDQPATSIFTIEDDDVAAPFNVQLDAPVDERINTINARYLNTEITGNRDSSEIYIDNALKTAEGYEVSASIDLPHTSSPVAAKRLAFMRLYQLRAKRRLVLPVSDIGAAFNPRDVVTLNFTYGAELNGLYRVLSREPNDTGYNLSLREYAPNAYSGIGGF